MSALRRTVRRAQLRLWFIRWVRLLGWSLAAAGGVFGVVVLVGRLLGLDWPLASIALVLAGCAIVGAAVACAWSREDAVEAATCLDRNAGLKERLSTGLLVESGADPFERAVHRDAESMSASLTVRQHIRFPWPDSMGYGLATAVLAGLLVWLMPQYDLLGREQKRRETRAQQERLAQVREEVTQQIERIKKTARRETDLTGAPTMKALDELAVADVDSPEALRREAIKKLGKLEDDLQARRDSAQFDTAAQMQSLLRELRNPRTPPSAVGELQKALAKGDFQAASKALEALQQQLNQAQEAGDPAKAAELQKQLAALADKLNKISTSQKQTERQLKQAGLDNEQIRDLLSKLPQMDAGKLAEALKDANPNLNAEQLKQLSQRIMQNQGAAQAAQQLAQNLQNAAGGLDSEGGMQPGAAQGMMAAGQQLSELEQMQQQMDELQAALNEIRMGMNQLGNVQPGGQPNRPGAGMGALGQGRGGIATGEQTGTALQKRKAKVETEAGRIIGQTFIDGSQFKGEATAEFVESVRAAQDEAADALADDRVPRKYHDAIRKYYGQFNSEIGTTSPPANANED